jgi:hypothetical protein
MTTAVPGHHHPGLHLLAQEAEEAHLAGDGIRVLHLCRVAFDYLERRSRSKALGDLAIEDVRWSFSLALYWGISDYEFIAVRELLKEMPSRDETQCDRKVLSHVLALLDNPFSGQPTTELAVLPAVWVASRSEETPDIALFTFAVELTWTHDPFGDSWQDIARAWADNCPAGSVLAKALQELIARLRCQTYLAMGRWPKGCGSRDMPSQLPPLAEGYRFFVECQWEALDLLIREQVPRTRVDNPTYVPLFHLIHGTRFYRETGDSQLLSLSRLRLSASHQPMQVYENLRERAFLDHSLKLARAQGRGGGAAERATTFRLATLAELSALRAWDVMAWRYAVGEQAEVALELAGHTLDNGAEIAFARLGVVNAVRALQTDDTDTRFLAAIERLDTASSEERETVVREVLSMRPAEWTDADTVLKVMSDAIPENMLPDVARRSVELELTSLRLRSQRVSRLAFWGTILGYVPQTPELVAILKPALVRTCGHPMAWSEIYAPLVASLAKGPLEIAFEIIDTMVSQADQGFAAERWRIIFNACIKRRELKERALPWLHTAANGDAERQHRVARMENDFPRGPSDDAVLRESLIEQARRFAASTDHTGNIPINMNLMAGVSPQPFRLVTWKSDHIPFIEELARAIDNVNGMPTEKRCLLQILAEIAEAGEQAVVDVVASHANRWLSNPVPYLDPTATHSGPLSMFNVIGMGPETLELGLWWLGDSLLTHQPEVVRDVLTARVLRQGLSAPDAADLVFSVMLRLALSGAVPVAPTSMAIIGMSEGLATISEPDHLGRLVETFGALLDGDFSIARLGDNDAGRMLLENWTRRLPVLAQASSVVVRKAVARALRIWSGLLAKHTWVSFPEQLAVCLETLKYDARARVRWEASEHPEREE